MTNPNSGNIPMDSHEQHWPMAIAALAVGTAFFSLWFWLRMQWLGFRVEMAGAAHWRWLAALPSVITWPCAERNRQPGKRSVESSGLKSTSPVFAGCSFRPSRFITHRRIGSVFPVGRVAWRASYSWDARFVRNGASSVPPVSIVDRASASISAGFVRQKMTAVSLRSLRWAGSRVRF